MNPEIKTGTTDESEKVMDKWDWGIGTGASLGTFIAGVKILEKIYEQDSGYVGSNTLLDHLAVLSFTTIAAGFGAGVVSGKIRHGGKPLIDRERLSQAKQRVGDAMLGVIFRPIGIRLEREGNNVTYIQK